MAIALLILGIILFVGLVVVHEYGHFIFARRNGVVAEEFGIGFPPTIWSRKVKSKKGDFIFSLNWIFLGGFVRLKGEHDSDTEAGTFGAASTWVKTKIMAAGIAMNLLSALVLFMIVGWIGMPQLIDGQFRVASDSHLVQSAKDKDVIKIGDVIKGSPAEKAGIQAESRVLSVNGQKITSVDQVLAATKTNAGKTVSIVTAKDGKQKTTKVTLNTSSPYLGIGPYSAQTGFDIYRSTWSAPVVAVGVTADFTVATVKGLGTALKGVGSIIAGALSGNTQARQTGQEKASSQVSGPVGIIGVMYAGAKQGIGFVLFIVGLVSLSLAIMNVLPIPALDGGKLFITYLSRILRRPISEKFENYAYGISFMLLIGLMLLVTVVDVKRLSSWF